MSTSAVWLIILLPLASAALIGLLLHPYHRLSAALAILAIAGSGLLALQSFVAVWGAPHHVLELEPTTWLRAGELKVSFTLMVDSLTAVMLLVVTSVSLIIQVYSLGYMHGDGGYARFFGLMSLFTASMLGLVLADNLLLLYVFWELVGLCSYLLIGFWFQRPAAAAAAKKAFIVTRFGDFGFLVALLLLYANTGTLSIAELGEMARLGTLAGAILTWGTLGIFAGAVGKSGQFPLHVWLPDAMEGPTPVSALIHAATMVAAGVYLVARTFPLFVHAELALQTVAIIGGFTAIFAASMGLVMTDIKRVLAYSTVSQLGYMMLALGVGAYPVAIFHLMNHAFFKALLFMASGSVHHAVATYDIRFMGGLRGAMPWTFATFLIASLSLAGVPPLSGFWSKDEILQEALIGGQPFLFALALGAVFMTAFYMLRLCFVVFGGTFRGGAPAEALASGGGGASHEPLHLHESPAVMVVPLVVLAVPSLISGFLNPPPFLAPLLGLAPHGLSEFLAAPPLLHEALAARGHEAAPFNWGLAALSTSVALAGITLAWAMYGVRVVGPKALERTFSPLYRLLINKYWLDELYQAVIDRLLLGGSHLLELCDRNVVEGVVNGVGSLTRAQGATLRTLQSGQAQLYGMAFLVGVVLLLAIYLVAG